MRHAAARRHRGAVSRDAGDGAAPRLPLKYRFAPGHPLDGLTADRAAGAAQPARRGAARPGWCRAWCARRSPTTSRRCPRRWRNRLVPLPDSRDRIPRGGADTGRVPLPDALRAWLRRAPGRRAAGRRGLGRRVDMPPHLAVQRARRRRRRAASSATGRDLDGAARATGRGGATVVRGRRVPRWRSAGGCGAGSAAHLPWRLSLLHAERLTQRDHRLPRARRRRGRRRRWRCSTRAKGALRFLRAPASWRLLRFALKDAIVSLREGLRRDSRRRRCR